MKRRFTALSVSLISLLASAAYAQAPGAATADSNPAPPAAAPPAAVAEPAPGPAAPPVVVPPPAPTPAAKPECSKGPYPTGPVPAPPGLPIRAMGIIRAAAVVTTGVQSFAYPTAAAITAAANPALLADAGDMLLSFQTQQTRAGVVVGEGTPVKGTIELDFVHFDTSSPTVQAFPRLRLGLVDWTVAPGQRVFLGQTWDIYGPVNTHSFNLVGNLFNAGNTGFMRQQLAWLGKFGDLEVAVAAGMQGANAGATFNNVERSVSPSVAARLGYYLAPTSWFGVSAIASSLRLTSGALQERRDAFSANAFGDMLFGSINVRAEAYVAQNGANLGLLNLGAGRFGSDVMDGGGFVSVKMTLGAHAVALMGGMATALDAAKVVPGYAPGVVAAGATKPVLGVAAPAAGPGIESNATVHLAYSFSPGKGVQLIAEPYLYSTRYKLAASDTALNVQADAFAYGLECGALYSF